LKKKEDSPGGRFDPACVNIRQLKSRCSLIYFLCYPGLIGTKPTFDILPAPERRVDSSTLRQILECIREGVSIEIHYQSLSSPASGWRRITPHALASDGLRWHVRAYCHTKEEFRDFVLGRIMDIRDKQTSEILGAADTEWNEFVNVTIA
jgi:predicted DNA-binding transcriptional regulator YafY